jgi:serum/glucocorticoid-regulated kinase 2
MESNLPVKDGLEFAKKDYIKKNLGHDEKILWSDRMNKTNRHGRSQARCFALTNKNLMNLGSADGGNWFKRQFAKDEPLRVMSIKNINGVTYSTMGQSLALHIDGDYDYLLNGDKRDELVYYILAIRAGLGLPTTKLYFTNALNLTDYVKIRTMERDVKKPQDCRTLSASDFKKLSEEGFEEKTMQRAVTVYAKGGNKPTDIEDWKRIKVLGTGGFAKVYLVLKRDTEKLYAMKELSKVDYIKNDSIDSLVNEQKIMAETNHPYLMTLDYCFHDPKKLYFVMEYMPGGELYGHLKLHKRFKEEEAKLLFAQIVLGIKFLHKKNIIYRDLKPENIFLDEQGFIKIGDFGISKQLRDSDAHTQTFVGTPEYFAPEIVLKKPYGKQVDCWALGIFLYEMLIGHSPFRARSYQGVIENIVKQKVLFPSKLDLSRKVIDLVIKLLKKDPKDRLGAKNGISDIMNHVWFNDIKWNDIYNKKFTSPLAPDCTGKKEQGSAFRSAKTFQDNDDTDDLTRKEEMMVEAYEDNFDDLYHERDDISVD